MLLHRMTLISFRLFTFRKNLGYFRECFGQIVYRPPPPPSRKIARMPMGKAGIRA